MGIGIIGLLFFLALFKMTNHNLLQFTQNYELKEIPNCHTYNECSNLLTQYHYTPDEIKEILVCEDDKCYIKVHTEKVG